MGYRPGTLSYAASARANDGRGATGLLLDSALYPLNYADGEDAGRALAGTMTLRSVNYTSFHLGTYRALKQHSIDDYSAIKSAYEQRLEDNKRLFE